MNKRALFLAGRAYAASPFRILILDRMPPNSEPASRSLSRAYLWSTTNVSEYMLSNEISLASAATSVGSAPVALSKPRTTDP